MALQPTPARDPHLSQGTSSQPGHRHSGDPHDQAARSGQAAHNDPQRAGPYDAAARGKKAEGVDFGGNPEGVGFAEQVGGASAAASKGGPRPALGEGKTGKEESTPPGFVASVKSKLGLGTTSGEVKQNRGEGKGVTGTGTGQETWGNRSYHVSAVRLVDKTRGQAPKASREPKERTNADQNSHLEHRTSRTAPDSGKGNAGENPELPSRKVSAYMRLWNDIA